jgi:hypothetical protein
MNHMNLVSIVMQFLTPDLIGRLAAMLGVGKLVIQKATGASIPAILAGLGGLAGQGGGAGKIVDAISKPDPNILGTIASTIGAQGQRALATTGTNILGSLLGGSTLSALTAALTKYAGLNQTSAGNLIGTLALLSCSDSSRGPWASMPVGSRGSCASVVLATPWKSR